MRTGRIPRVASESPLMALSNKSHNEDQNPGIFSLKLSAMTVNLPLSRLELDVGKGCHPAN